MQATAIKIVQTAAAECGVTVPQTLQSTQDPGTIQLLTLLNSAGYETCAYYPWTQLSKFQLLTTEPDKGDYPLPDDWFYYLDQTQYNVTNNQFMRGPISPQQWQPLKSGLNPSSNFSYRIIGKNLELLPIPASAVELSLNYISNGWVDDGHNIGAVKSSIVYDDDMPLFDWLLMVKFLKLKLWEAKGFDTTAYKDDFTVYWESLVGKDVGAPILDVACQAGGMHLIDAHNIPSGNWPIS